MPSYGPLLPLLLGLYQDKRTIREGHDSLEENTGSEHVDRNDQSLTVFLTTASAQSFDELLRIALTNSNPIRQLT
jgi:hypothetical protein